MSTRQHSSIGGGDALIVTCRRIQDAVMVVSVPGEIDALTAPQLLPAIERCVADGPPLRLLVVDLTPVTFLGSPGLKALLDVQAFSGQRDLPIRFVAADNRHATRPLEITGLDKVLTLRRSVDDALQEFDSEGNVHSPGAKGTAPDDA
jgi:anti-sigma B factor antagonist